MSLILWLRYGVHYNYDSCCHSPYDYKSLAMCTVLLIFNTTYVLSWISILQNTITDHDIIVLAISISINKSYTS